MLHEFSRTELLIGHEAIEKLARSKVAVFGIGGVGTFAVEGLVRAGIGNFVLVDDDCVCLTNINRQIHATHKTVGRPKVEVMRERILDINPRAQVACHQTFYMPGLADALIHPDYDYIVDAIDTVTAKIDLIVNASQQDIPIISCMGAGNKLNPAMLEVADIYDTSVCPLAKVMRKELRKRGVKRLKVVYSKEEPLKPRASEATEDSTRTCTSRRQIPGSISFMPSVAGLLMASEVVKDLIRGV
ncbi:MAG: tRNA threonylcarbamoyladenosine dehydratase [Syntrophomonadaceae bacterium]|jgi:tRNA A37 threonylcarbamoyladenosine dehydratase